MKIKIYFFFVATLFAGFMMGQNNYVSKRVVPYDSVIIEEIKELVDSIRLKKNLEIINVDSISLSSKFSDERIFYNAIIYHKNKEIVKMSLTPVEINFVTPYSTALPILKYYISENQLIYTEEKYTDRSRMGSCGTLSIENRLFYKHGDLLKATTKESPFACYHQPIKIDWLFENFENVYDLGVKRIKKLRN